MSKASEWSINHNRSENLRPSIHFNYGTESGRERDGPVGTVNDYGCLILRMAILDADQALQLRDWLTETFDEPR